MLEYLQITVPMENKLPVVVRGDSELIIQFMLGMSKPGKRALVELVTKAKKLVKDMKHKVVFQHVPRAENAWADWLSQVAMKLRVGGQLTMSVLQSARVQRLGEVPRKEDLDLIHYASRGDKPTKSITCGSCQ